MRASVLCSPVEVVSALVTYTDWWQPGTASIIQVGAARRSTGHSDGMPASLLSGLDVRDQLCRRMEHLEARDRRLLFLWYVAQRSVDEIAGDLRISRRQCFRRRAATIRKLVELGDPRWAA